MYSITQNNNIVHKFSYIGIQCDLLQPLTDVQDIANDRNIQARTSTPDIVDSDISTADMTGHCGVSMYCLLETFNIMQFSM